MKNNVLKKFIQGVCRISTIISLLTLFSCKVNKAYDTYGGHIVDVVNDTIFKGEIKILDGKIVDIYPKDDVPDRYIAPGFVDAHVHIESSMLLPSAFAAEAVRHGTIAVVSDPHEIANVLGMSGVEFMIENSRKVNFKFGFGAPSCVPATTFETSGATLGVDEVRSLLQKPEISHLSEVMNYPGVIYEDPEVLQKIEAARMLNKPIDGHAPGLSGDDLAKYISAGISTDHESTSLYEAQEKISGGMKILIREGSAAKNFEALHYLIDTYPDEIMFCTDDIHPDDLVEGHINSIAKRAIEKGYDLLTVLKIASYNPIKHYKLPVGLLQIGDPADFVIFDDPQEFNILHVFIDGIEVAARGKSYIEHIIEEPINQFHAQKISAEDIKIQATSSHIRVIDIIPNELLTRQSIHPAYIIDGLIESDIERDIIKIVMLNRYTAAKPTVAFIRNSGLIEGAIASSIVHDSHNIIAIGVNDTDIANAINHIIDMQGGIVAYKDSVLSALPLPFAGLLDNQPSTEIATKYKELDRLAKEMGSNLQAPFMTLSFMGLLVIPELKISDQGLFDGVNFEFTTLEIKN